MPNIRAHRHDLPYLLFKVQVVLNVSLLSGLPLPGYLERFQPILADGFQHHQVWFLSLLFDLVQQVLVQERGDCIQDPFRSPIQRYADGLDRFQGAATYEDREPPEEALFLGTQEIIAPGDSVAQGLLAGWSILCAAG